MSWIRTSIGPESLRACRPGQAGSREGDDYRRATWWTRRPCWPTSTARSSAVVATFGEPVADVLGPIAASGSRHRARMVLSWPAATARRGQGAAAVELLHLGTLVHDDIVDGSPLRRHSPTLHIALGMPVALWTADALYAEALHLADAVSPAGGLALGGALRRIADSQVLEALGATTARYWDVVDGKTVSLFEASFALADEAAGGSLPQRCATRCVGTGACSSTSTTCRTSAVRPTRWASPPGWTPTTSCTRCRRPTSWCRADEVRARLRELVGSDRATRRAAPSGPSYFGDVTDRLLDAAARVLDRAPA